LQLPAPSTARDWPGASRASDVTRRRCSEKSSQRAWVAWLFRRRGGRDGSPPITAALHDLGWKVSKNTVAASMRSQGLVARPKKKRRGLTRADRRARKAPDLLKRDFAPPPAVNQRWVSDLTEIPTGEGTLYLASILDLNSRRCVGYALGVHHDADLAAAALCVAIAVRGGDVAGVVFHTDQGGEYTGGELTKVCARAGIVQSMGRTGSALDNAVAEAFHSTIEFELLSRRRFATRAEARRAVVAWLEEYNTVRLHSTNGLITPVDYEHGRRRPGAKPYDQLRRRRHHQRPPDGERDQNNPAEAASPPLIPVEPLRDGHRRCAVSGPVPPASSAAAAVADATALRAALDPGASTGPGRQPQRQATACRHARAPQLDQDP